MYAFAVSSFVMFFTVFALFAGCDSFNKNLPPSAQDVVKETQSEKPEDRVASRAGKRWQARIDKDWKAVYGFMSPGYRSTHPYEIFAAQMARSPLLYRKATVEKVSCEDEERCTVKLNIESEYRGTQTSFQGQVSTSIVEEQWIKLDDQWWFGR